MIEWITENPQLFICLVGIALDLVIGLLVIFRKIKVNSSDSIKHLIDENLPGFINVAEESELDGPYKLGFVVSNVLSKIRKYIKKSDWLYYKCYIEDRVEAILSTPQKKEKSE